MGLFDKIRSMVNGDDANNAYEDEDMGATYDDSAVPARPVNRGMSINAASIELKVVRPDTFINSRQIADHLLNNRTVVLNLEATNKETARRILDFLSGVAYAQEGDIRPAASKTYIITPRNVDLLGDQPDDMESGEFHL